VEEFGPGGLLGQGGCLDSSNPRARGYTGHQIESPIFTPDGFNHVALPRCEVAVRSSAAMPQRRHTATAALPTELKRLFRFFGYSVSF
jgi:hypothetical protein